MGGVVGAPKHHVSPAQTNAPLTKYGVSTRFAGHETTAGTLSFVLLFLAAHPAVKAKLQQEVDEVLGDRDRLEHEDLSRFRYMTCVLKEVLRLYPIGYGTVRQPPTDVVVGGHAIPAGVS
jgi:cytochrome P450